MTNIARAVSALPTTAAKIRALAAKGHPRAEIARALGVRYQQVRNVLVREEAKIRESLPPGQDSVPGKIEIDANGCAVVPPALIKAVGGKPGDVLFARIGDGQVHLLTRAAVTRRIQAHVREFVPEGVSLVDELLEDRRREAEAEAHNG
jgi:Helix-turn-helix domain